MIYRENETTTEYCVDYMCFILEFMFDRLHA